MNYFSANPAKASLERFWLLYTVVWGTIAGIVMMGGFGNWWPDVPLLIFGVSLGLGAVIGALIFRAPLDKQRSWYDSTAAKMSVSVILFAFLLNYSQTPFFWDVMHMHYGFQSTINIQNNPIFLYFLTIAYFATYSVLVMMAYRFAKARLAGSPAPLRYAAYFVVPFAVAGLETALNANPFTASVFCYDDMQFMAWFGTLSYGDAFLFALPVWVSIDEDAAKPTSMLNVVVWTLAAVYGHILVLEFLRYNVAPHFTDVVTGANGLRDFGTSCLVPLTGAP